MSTATRSQERSAALHAGQSIRIDGTIHYVVTCLGDGAYKVQSAVDRRTFVLGCKVRGEWRAQSVVADGPERAVNVRSLEGESL